MKLQILAIYSVFCLTTVATAQALTPVEQLGKSIFFDENLSINGNQACAACHSSATGFTGPNPVVNAHGAVYEGSIAGRFGNRKPPSSAYATPSPILGYVIEEGKEALFSGGNFWDGRATGEKLGNPAADQAQGPFLNPLEQALPDPIAVVSRVCGSTYAPLFLQVWGANACDAETVSDAYDYIALSIAAYEASPESNAFTSKYDYYLKGVVSLTKEEKKGLNLFQGKAQCANCHTLNRNGKGDLPLLTDFTFDNLGVPRNPENPFYSQAVFNPLGTAWIDLGLGDFLASRLDYQQFAAENYGKQKVPTLRNVDKRPYAGFAKAYAHNGYFKSLKGIVHFYNTRDAKPTCANPFTTEADALAQSCWPEPEVATNVNRSELGNLHLTADQEDAIVEFLKALSDGYVP